MFLSHKYFMSLFSLRCERNEVIRDEDGPKVHVVNISEIKFDHFLYDAILADAKREEERRLAARQCLSIVL